MSSIDHAIAAAEAIRALNHATIQRSGYQWPSDIDAVIGELQTMAERLPQALEQIDRWLEWAMSEGLVGDDRNGARPSVTVSNAQMDLCAAIREAGGLAHALRIVRSQTTHLTGYPRDEEDA